MLSMRFALACACALVCLFEGAAGFAAQGSRTSRFASTRVARRRGASPTMGMLSIFEKLFAPSVEKPQAMAVSRLNLMLASDRAMIDNDTLVKIRNGIIELVQKYVDIQADDVILNISTEQRTSILTASLAIKGRKVLEASVDGRISPPPTPSPMPPTPNPMPSVMEISPLSDPLANPPADEVGLSEEA
jgi:cell division topological specificity factor